MFSEALACCGGCKGPLHFGHLPYTSSVWGCLPICLHPPLIHWLPCASVCFRDICMQYEEYFPYVGGLGGVPHLVGVFGASAHGVFICFFLYILVVYYVSHFYYRYDYYSSSYGGVFWAVICFISDHGYFPDGASCNIGSV